MFELKLFFDEVSIRDRFKELRFHLETAAGSPLPVVDINRLLQVMRTKTDIRGSARMLLDACRDHTPTQVLKFAGMKKFSATWWVALVEFTPTKYGGRGKPPLLYGVLIGWDNNHGTTSTVVSMTGQLTEAASVFTTRLDGKKDSGYNVEQEFQNIALNTLEVPELPGLPSLKIEIAGLPKGSTVSVKSESVKSELEVESSPLEEVVGISEPVTGLPPLPEPLSEPVKPVEEVTPKTRARRKRLREKFGLEEEEAKAVISVADGESAVDSKSLDMENFGTAMSQKPVAPKPLTKEQKLALSIKKRKEETEW